MERLLSFLRDRRRIGRDPPMQHRAVGVTGQPQQSTEFLKQGLGLFQTFRGRDHLRIFPQPRQVSGDRR